MFGIFRIKINVSDFIHIKKYLNTTNIKTIPMIVNTCINK